MINLNTFKKEFDHRHDFAGSDVELLGGRHPDVNIFNIPVAWVFPVDEMLCRFRYNRAIKEVRQEFGQLIVTFKNRPADQGRYSKYKSIVDECERKIKSIDIDLHASMERQ